MYQEPWAGCSIIDGQLLSFKWKDWARWFGSSEGWSVITGSGKVAHSNSSTLSTDCGRPIQLFSAFSYGKIKSCQGFPSVSVGNPLLFCKKCILYFTSASRRVLGNLPLHYLNTDSTQILFFNDFQWWNFPLSCSNTGRWYARIVHRQSVNISGNNNTVHLT